MRDREAATSHLSIRLATCPADVEAVQRLRWEVFFDEMGAAAVTAAPSYLDRDDYDVLCDHLLVTDRDAHGAERVVGTYRLLREGVAARAGGFYSAHEFDIAGLGCTSGELLELGRSCVMPAYRTSATIALLWRGIAEYIRDHRIGLMFGCASFPGTDPAPHLAALSYLHHRHLADPWRRPRVRKGKGAALRLLEPGAYDERRAMFALPPLIKGYLRVGAQFGEGAYVDHAFNTVDVCVVMPVEAISDRYAARFSVAV
jgi:putative hemolysin